MNVSNWLDSDVLEDYLDGKLDAQTMYQIEKISLEDPFLAEALSGLSQSPRRTQALSLLQKQLQERLALKPVEQKRWRITSQRLSIASAAAVLFITVSLLFWMKESRYRAVVKGNPAGQVEVAVAAAAPILLSNSSPAGGWEEYQKYLKANNRLTKNGTTGSEVMLTFQVTKAGLPSDIKILKGSEKANEAEAIRLVKKGPKWNFQPEADPSVTLIVKF